MGTFLLRERKAILNTSFNNWLSNESKWYLFYVKSGDLKRVSRELNDQDIYTYRAVTNRPGKTGQPVKTNLLSNYIFVYLCAKQINQVPYINDRISVVYDLNRPVQISNDDLESMHSFLKTNEYVYFEHNLIGSTKETLAAAVDNEKISLPSTGITLTSFNIPVLQPIPQFKLLANLVNYFNELITVKRRVETPRM